MKHCSSPGRLDAKTVVYMLFNFVTSVGIVLCNKYVFHHFHFDYATFITALHFFSEYIIKRHTPPAFTILDTIFLFFSCVAGVVE